MSSNVIRIAGRNFYSDELYHHGIKGQKWGVRRNLAGLNSSKKSLTKEEKQSTIKDKKIDAQYYNTVKKPKYDFAQSVANESSKSVNAIRTTRSQLKSKPKAKVTNLSKMSDDELRQKINRMNLEEQYTRLMDNRESRKAGRDYVDSALAVAGTALTVTGSVVAIANGIKQLKN